MRVRVDGSIYDLTETIPLDKNRKHNIEIVVDRVVIRPDQNRRLTDAVEIASALSGGLVLADIPEEKREILFSQNYACDDCGISIEELTPRMFSFNSPYGACPTCGGLGTRLYPYTKILPKPLIPVGEQPIAELIFSRFRDFGCRHMTMIVNYKRGMIKSYFADLEKDYTVDFIDEDVFMGTGGGLCLLKGRMDSPFFFTNCDTLLDLDYGDLYQYHKAHGNLVTMVCAFKHYVVPYGVVELGEDGGIAAMREKPELNFLTNTGVYVVEPRVVEEMKMGEVIGFPDVIDRYRAAGEKVGIYPINESSWMDMGQMEELEKMRRKLEQQS